VVPLGTVHVAVSKRIFRFNQCVFSIVLNFGVSVDEIAGDHNQVRVRRISACLIPVNVRDTDSKLIRSCFFMGEFVQQ
jgi:hypothetical protein